MTRHRQHPDKSLVTDARKVARKCAGMNARLAARRITRFLETRMAPAGLSFAQFSLMAAIAAAGDGTIGDLAARTALDQSTLSRNLRGLEQAGLIEIVVAERDRRRRAIWLTEAGALRLEAAIPIWKKADAALAKLIDTADARRLSTATEALSDHRQGKPGSD